MKTVNYSFNQPYVTCHIKVMVCHDIDTLKLYYILSNLDYNSSNNKYHPEYGPFDDNKEYKINDLSNYQRVYRCQMLAFKYNEYNVIVNAEYLVIENRQEMNIKKKENVLELINAIWRLLKCPGFITKYEYITKVEVRSGLYDKIYKNSFIDVTIFEILKILSNHPNSIFHYIPMDIINVISYK